MQLKLLTLCGDLISAPLSDYLLLGDMNVRLRYIKAPCGLPPPLYEGVVWVSPLPLPMFLGQNTPTIP